MSVPQSRKAVLQHNGQLHVRRAFAECNSVEEIIRRVRCIAYGAASYAVRWRKGLLYVSNKLTTSRWFSRLKTMFCILDVLLELYCTLSQRSQAASGRQLAELAHISNAAVACFFLF